MRQKRRLFLGVCSIVFLLMTVMAQAGDLTVEKELQEDLRQSRSLLGKIAGALVAGESYSSNFGQLKGLGDSIRVGHQLLHERFRDRENRIDALGGKAVSRHAAMQAHFEQSVGQYLADLDGLDEASVNPAEIQRLQSLIEAIVPRKNARIHGSVPYRHLNLPMRAPQIAPAIVPAYRGGNRTVTEADLAAGPEASISLEIAQLAQSLNWNPVEMYEWVKNNIRTEWYWGAMKGSEETLRQMSGNDADQAALLVAMFRSAGFPARYVRGVIEFFPDLEEAKRQTGLADPSEIAQLLQKAGIPYAPVIAGGRVNNFRFEHVWVEVEIPYDNYRGVVIDEHGKTWLPLDTSLKVLGYSANVPADALKILDLSKIRESYLADLKSETPLEYLADRINSQLVESRPGTSYENLLLTRTIKPESMKIVPGNLQFQEIAVTGEYAALPDALLHKARFLASTTDGALIFDQNLPVRALSNRSLALTFEPETVEDQEIMNAYGGLGNTPAYLVRLRPVLTVDGEREIQGRAGLAAGADFNLTLELLAPGVSARFENILTAGYPTTIGLAAQQAVAPAASPLAGKDAERLLYEQASSYIGRWDQAEAELAALFQMSMVRPLPTVVVLGGVLDVSYLLDAPHGYEWQGVYLDAEQRIVEPIGGVRSANSPNPKALFMQLSALQGSVLESRIFEEGFGVESVSTAKLLALANEGGIPVAVIDSANIDSALPGLNLPEAIAEDIANAVNQGDVVTIPAMEMRHEEWSGFGYRKENPATGESGWMLSGMLAGGMTALNPERWPEEYYDPLANPLQGEVNHDPDSAVELVVLAASEGQQGVVGKPLPLPLQLIARDAQMRPVPGVQVNFRVLAGGGRLSAASALTDSNGIASVDLVPGEHISDNPTSWFDTPHSWTVGENLVDASTPKGLRTRNPITAFAFPAEPHHLNITGGGATGEILSWSDTIKVRVEDRYSNSISNVPVTFSMGNALSKATCLLANGDLRPGLLVSISDPCLQNNIPVYGDCGAANLSETTWDFGAAAQVVLGGIPEADYPVTVKAGDLPAAVVTVASKPFGNCDGDSLPEDALVLKSINLSDQYGNIIDAAAVGSTIPLKARLYMLSEGGIDSQKQFDCPTGPVACPVLLGNRQYTVDPDLTSASVSFDGQEANLLDKGLFELPAFAVGNVAGKKNVTITGKDNKIVRQPAYVCSTPPDCTPQDIEVELEVSLTKEVYAVDISLTNEQYLVPVSAEGYALTDTVLGYTILPHVPGNPAESYTAGTAMVRIAQRQADGTLEPLAYLDTEPSGPGFATLARGFNFDPESEYVAQVVLNHGSNGGEIVSREMVLTPSVVEIGMNPDYNRDGFINEQDQGLVTLEKPWRFWVNDDDDKDSDPTTGLTTDGLISDPDDLPGQDEDNDDNQVNGIRDLVDFFALQLDLGRAPSLLPPEQGYRYFLKNADAALGMVEGIATGVVLTADHASEHLENPTSGILFGGLGARAINAAGLELSAAFLQAVKDNSQAGIVLLEGRKPTTSPLVLEVRDKSGMAVISQGFPLEILAVEGMYGHKNLRAEAGGAGGEIDRFVNFTDQNSPDYYLKAKQPYCMQGVEKNLVWMHGYNVTSDDAMATFAEVFKRFFHAGLNGRFYGVSWYGDPPAFGAPHYHQAVVNAFATAKAYKDLIGAIPGSTSLAAHSLGNLVVGSAIHDHGFNGFDKYFAIDASIALEAYGQVSAVETLAKPDGTIDTSIPNAGMVNVGEWPKYIAAGQSRLLASEWYKRFEASDPSDNRAKLTWRNRLNNVPSSKVYNFFSSTEEVLRRYDDDNLFFDGNGWSLDALAISSWVKQEKYKGLRSALNIFDNLGGVASSYCGWRFGENYKEGTLLPPLSRIFTPEEAASRIQDDELMSKPFFALGDGLDVLASPAGSAFADRLIAEDSGLNQYYTDNATAHNKVKIRDWLLAEAFPATTLPMGANTNGILFIDGQNIDMSGVTDNVGGCCKTNGDLWPREERYQNQRVWKHSDYKDVPYQHVNEFYNKIAGSSAQ